MFLIKNFLEKILKQKKFCVLIEKIQKTLQKKIATNRKNTLKLQNSISCIKKLDIKELNFQNLVKLAPFIWDQLLKMFRSKRLNIKFRIEFKFHF
jgi:hypothetical protein